MTKEFETAGFLSLGGFFRRGAQSEILAPGTPCPNCQTPLEGAWCHKCGQLAEDFHRSTAKLLFESVREFFDVDNRAWQTLPDLLFRPGRLTRAYLEGHRAPQVPPLRLFLVVLVLLFLVGVNIGSTVPRNIVLPTNNPREQLSRIENDKNISEADKREIESDIKSAHVQFGNGKPSARAKWLEAHIKYAVAHQTEFWQAVQNWAERFAFLMLPLSALLLGLLFVFQRRFFLYDHIIFSMHSLSFVCLLVTATIAWNHYLRPDLGGWPLFAAPVHLYFHMRGVYGSSVAGTLFRMFLLFIGSAIGATFIVLGLLWVAVASVGGA